MKASSETAVHFKRGVFLHCPISSASKFSQKTRFQKGRESFWNTAIILVTIWGTSFKTRGTAEESAASICSNEKNFIFFFW